MQANVAGIGDTLRLSSNEKGSEVEVTLMAVVDPAHAGPFNRPRRAHRLVAVRLRLRNVGSTVYNDSPSNGAVLVDHKSQQFHSYLGGLEPDLGSPTINTGDERLGFITFELPKNSEPRLFQITLDSGFGPEAGEWRL